MKALAVALVVVGVCAVVTAFFLLDWRAGLCAVGVVAIIGGSVFVDVDAK